jgi:colanic acid/amylovoran biosynthesis glycosyltransferase
MVGKLLLRFIIKRTDMLLPVSTYIRYSLEKLSGTNFKHKIIPMGICVDKFRYASDNRGKLRRSLGISRTDKIFLFSGNIVEKQGIHLLLQAADSLKNDHTDFHIVIIGDGPLVPFFKKWVTKLGLSDKIKFLGWVEKELLPRYLAMSDAVVVPLVIDKQGETDGLPVVIQEALACGVPLIASRVSGINDVIKDGYNGWLFEPDNYGDLKTKMELVYTSSPAEIKALRDNALKTLNLFSCQTVAREYYSVIKNFLYPYHT